MAEIDLRATFKDKRLRKFLSQLDKNSKSIRKRRKDYAVALSANVFEDIMNHFEREEGPKVKWVSWSNTYQKRMDRQGKGGNKILQDSGTLRKGIIPIKSGKNWKKDCQGS